MHFDAFHKNITFSQNSSAWRQLNTLIEKTVTYQGQRWLCLCLLAILITYRAVKLEFFAILYISFIYLIYLIVQYFTPAGLPDPDEELEDQASLIENNFNLNSSERDRPLTRAITEFVLWKRISLVCVLVWICSFFQIFKIPVYWPFLLTYFVWLVGLAIQRHCRHMKVYRYSIADFNQKAGEESEFF